MNFQRTQRTRESGFTLVELIIAMVLFGIMLTAIFSTITQTQKRYVQQRTTTRSQETLGLVEQTVSRLFRSARTDPRGTAAAGINPNPLGHAAWDNVQIRSDFNVVDGDTNDMLENVQLSVASDTLFVRWQAGGATTAMSYPVKSMLFEYYSAAGVKLTNAADISTGAARVKFTIRVPGKTSGAPLVTRTTWVTIRNI